MWFPLLKKYIMSLYLTYLKVKGWETESIRPASKSIVLLKTCLKKEET